MELYQLRSFVAIAEEKHLTRAAQRLFTSQPAISLQIKSLEEELGVSLFVRTRKGMKLTSEGEVLQQEAYRILESVDRMLQVARSLNQELAGTIRLGINEDYDFLHIQEFLRKINDISTSIEMRFYHAQSGDILLQIQQGLLDIGTIWGNNPYSEITLDSLPQVQFYVAGAEPWKADIESADPQRLAQLPWIWPTKQCPYYEYLENFAKKYGHRTQNRVYANTDPIIDALVYSGKGIGLLRADKALKAEQEGLLYLWKDETLIYKSAVAYLKKRADDPLVTAVRQVFQEIFYPEKFSESQ